MTKKYSLSTFVKQFDKGMYTALFNGLTLKKMYAKTQVIEPFLKSIQHSVNVEQKNIFNPLIENGFLVEPRLEKDTFNRIKNSVGKINISNVRLLVSNDCNFACAYCQIEENMEIEQKKFHMPIKTAEKALGLFEKNSRSGIKKTITMTGGEPLLNMPTVRYVISRVKNMNNVRTVIFTNGSLVTRELADYFAKENILMLVSLDGNKDIHDSVRKKRKGQGTYDISLRGYELLKKAGCKVGISAVAGIHNINRMDEVTNLFLSIDPPSIGLNFGHYLLDKPNPYALPMESFAEILTSFYTVVRDKNIFVENISRLITPFFQQKPRLNECQAQGRGLTVDSRGKIGPCKSLLVSDKVNKDIDSISDNLSDEAIFQKFATRSPFTMKQCACCNLIGFCGGGCTYDAFAINNGDIKKIDPRLCEYTNRIVGFLIWDLFEAIKAKIDDSVYIPSTKEQKEYFLKFYDPDDKIQRSVGHEKDR